MKRMSMFSSIGLIYENWTKTQHILWVTEENYLHVIKFQVINKWSILMMSTTILFPIIWSVFYFYIFFFLLLINLWKNIVKSSDHQGDLITYLICPIGQFGHSAQLKINSRQLNWLLKYWIWMPNHLLFRWNQIRECH